MGTSTNGGGLSFNDLDGDGKLDAVTSVGLKFGNASFATLRNISTPGNIAFEAPEYVKGLTDETPPYLVADIDGDGRAELIGGEGSSSAATDFWIVQNLSTPGNIEFCVSVGYFKTTVDALKSISIADLDNDGKPEILASNSFGSRFSIIKNTSKPGVFELTDIGSISTGQYNYSLQAEDFNGDGKKDLVWKKGSNIYIRLNTYSSGELSVDDFATEVVIPSELGNYGGMSIADVNGDGKADIVATDDGDLGIFENVYAGGTFDATAFIPPYPIQLVGNSTYPTAPRVADLNGDHKPDIIVGISNVAPERISILENKNIHAPAITISGVSPLVGGIGTTVTINGDHFSTNTLENHVKVGGIQAKVLTATKTELTIEVPAGTASGFISVTRSQLTATYRLPCKMSAVKRDAL